MTFDLWLTIVIVACVRHATAPAIQNSRRAYSMTWNRHRRPQVALSGGAKADVPGLHGPIRIGVSPAGERSLI